MQEMLEGRWSGILGSLSHQKLATGNLLSLKIRTLSQYLGDGAAAV